MKTLYFFFISHPYIIVAVAIAGFIIGLIIALQALLEFQNEQIESLIEMLSNVP